MNRKRGSQSETAPVIVADGLVKRFGKIRALDGLTLRARSGGVTAVLGPNGAGKTTFVRAIATLVRADSGSLRVAGIDVARHPERVRRIIGLAGQFAAIEPTKTGRENVLMVARLYGLPRRQAAANAAVVAQLVLEDVADRHVKSCASRSKTCSERTCLSSTRRRRARSVQELNKRFGDDCAQGAPGRAGVAPDAPVHPHLDLHRQHHLGLRHAYGTGLSGPVQVAAGLALGDAEAPGETACRLRNRKPGGQELGGGVDAAGRLVVSPLFANLALTAFDRRYQERWADWSRYRRRKRYRRDKGHPTYRLVRYSDDFVLLVMGTREQAEALKDEAAEILTELGLTLAREKTLVTHVDSGFDFLGFHIKRKPRGKGRRPCAYTFPSKEVLVRTKRKVKALTTRSTTRLPLEQILRAINPVLRGVAYYFRHAASSRAFSHLGYFTWWRIARWLRKKHPRRSWKWLKRRYGLFSRAGGIGFFNPGRVRIVRYYFQGAKIATPWNTEQMQGYGAAFRQITDERADLDGLQRSLVG